jgi:hypothetical protein
MLVFKKSSAPLKHGSPKAFTQEIFKSKVKRDILGMVAVIFINFL